MKKVLVLMAACATMVACQQKGKTEKSAEANDSAKVEATDSMRYAGELPAADGLVFVTKSHWQPIAPMVSV